MLALAKGHVFACGFGSAAVIRVLVAAMGDSARSVQEAAASALCEIARL
jgi:hypothetical protein